MNTRDAIALTGIYAIQSDKKIKDKELKTLTALMMMNPMYMDIINHRDYIAKLSSEYEEFDPEQIIDRISECLSPDMKETAYAWACALTVSDSGMGQDEHEFLKKLVNKFRINGTLAGKISAVIHMLSRNSGI